MREDAPLQRDAGDALTAAMEEGDVIIREEGALGRLTLNRPRALNALTLPMCETISAALEDWAARPDITAVLVDAMPGRAFCAGGDIRAIHDWGRAKDPRALRFFSVEYRMNALIARFPKPYVSLLDGITMGGGVGLSIHGSHRVASENTLFAMPETAIGLFPDVGGSYFLPRCPGEIGMYLGLTGARIGAADMLHAGLATHFVPSVRMGEVAPRLAAGEAVDKVLAALAGIPAPGALPELRSAIERAFGTETVPEILTGLIREGGWGNQTAEVLAARSPTSLVLTHRLLRTGRGQDLETCLAKERALVAQILEGHDFYEGVRAAVIDKDQTPKWTLSRLEDVDATAIARMVEAANAPIWDA
jgi:enoyl-CoA hydratase